MTATATATSAGLLTKSRVSGGECFMFCLRAIFGFCNVTRSHKNNGRIMCLGGPVSGEA